MELLPFNTDHSMASKRQHFELERAGKHIFSQGALFSFWLCAAAAAAAIPPIQPDVRMRCVRAQQPKLHGHEQLRVQQRVHHHHGPCRRLQRRQARSSDAVAFFYLERHLPLSQRCQQQVVHRHRLHNEQWHLRQEWNECGRPEYNRLPGSRWRMGSVGRIRLRERRCYLLDVQACIQSVVFLQQLVCHWIHQLRHERRLGACYLIRPSRRLADHKRSLPSHTWTPCVQIQRIDHILPLLQLKLWQVDGPHVNR